MDDFMNYRQTIIIAAITLCSIVFNTVTAARTKSDDDAFSQINQSTREMSTFSAKFKQIKKFRILTSQMVLEGSIYINRVPFKLAWHIEKPIGYTAIISEDRLLQWDKETDRTKEYKFSDNPMLGIIAKVYHDILLGDFSGIGQECDITVDKPACTVNVTPRAKSNMIKAVSKLTFVFNKDFRNLTSISIDECGGNSTVINFNDIKINGIIPEKAWKTGNDS
jgi:outer membrane lipoprotein-sorting protein